MLDSRGRVETKTPFKSQNLAPLAFAASILLSVALVLAIVFAPQAKKMDDKPHVVRVRIFRRSAARSPDPARAQPALWLSRHQALRRAGRR